ncbi:MAG TPA: hypothetical protein VMT34_10570 [Aggregatilineales bacterium]|nr:hypothetical protein [Aggregatilineales bacterium]
MDKYRPSNAVPFSGFITLIIAAILVALIAGGIVAFIANQFNFYLVMLFPLLMGIVAGGVTGLVVKSSKIRNPLVAALFGLLAGVGVYGVYHVGRYILFRQTTIQQIASENSVSQTEADVAFDQVLKKETGTTGFIGFMKYRADAGISIVPTSSIDTSGTISFSGQGVYIYWGLELLAIALISGTMASQQARQPFCENCNSWYTGKGVIGSVERKQSRQFVKLLKRGEFGQAKALFNTSQKFPRTVLQMDYCRTCQTGPVRVTAKSVNRRARSQGVLAHGMVSRERLPELVSVAAGTGGATPQA